jgi:hypothetical protein
MVLPRTDQGPGHVSGGAVPWTAVSGVGFTTETTEITEITEVILVDDPSHVLSAVSVVSVVNMSLRHGAGA